MVYSTHGIPPVIPLVDDAMIDHNQQSLTRLRRRWLMVAMLYMGSLGLGYQIVRGWGHTAYTTQWLTLAAMMMLIQVAVFWWALPYNHPLHTPQLFPTLGYANAMTLTRGALACLLAGFLFAPMPVGLLAWAPALLYTLERLLDYFDGYVARITGQETQLGVILDMEFDGLDFLIAIALAIQWGRLPVWYLVLGLARQLFVAGIWLRRRWHKPVFDLPPSDHRRLIAGFQTSFASVVLWPVLNESITLFAGAFFALALIFSFGRDWLVVSAVIDAASPAYQRGRTRLKQLAEGWLPLLARGVAAALVVGLFSQATPVLALWTLYGGVCLLATAALLLGIVGRVAALVLVPLACLDILAYGLHYTDNGLLLACLIVIIHLGSGYYALWQPEEPFLHRKLGAPREG